MVLLPKLKPAPAVTARFSPSMLTDKGTEETTVSQYATFEKTANYCSDESRDQL